jgi:calpain-15
LPGFAASHLVGVPEESILHSGIKDVDDFFQTMKNADKKKFVMMAASHGQGEITSDEGVVSGHAYSLISIHEIKDKRGQNVRLLKLRNPWGSGEWQGAWSDDSDEWTPEISALVG